ncbi:MAG: sugar ABC transporter ATP-binding protein [Ignavibacteriae bacterium]|nr:sugar ABC transporter ATP-binding protein [Ignavibacteriota bacterium]
MTQATPVPRFAMRGIRKRYGATVALQGVDLAVAPGEVHALIGENGAGKSTLMKVLAGAIRPDEGEMHLDGAPFSPSTTQAAREAGVAMIYQELSLAPHLPVGDNIMLGMEPMRFGLRDRTAIRDRAHEALAMLGYGSLDTRTRVGDLPIATRQVVEIARALAVGCKILVLDEPTSSLTLADIDHLFGVLDTLRSKGHAIVYISHFLEEVKRISDKFTVLRDGQTVGSGAIADHSIDEIVNLMIGRKLEQLYPHSKRTPGEIMIHAVGIGAAPKPVNATFDLRRGEVLGLAGLVGAGRTELLRTLFGLEPVVSGEITLQVHSGWASPKDRWQQGAGMVSEDRATEGLAGSLSVASNITMNLSHDTSPFGIVRPRHIDTVAREWIDRLGIRTRGPEQEVRTLSGGNQQKVAIARLLHEKVDILLLDEPTRGIDVASKSQIYELIDRLAAGDPEHDIRPRAILLVSSYLPELLGVCDRIAVMHRGTLGPARPAHEWTEHALLLAATGQGNPA